MKERPILFSDPMVRAILDGRKTQTRRVVSLKHVHDIDDTGTPMVKGRDGIWHEARCPYGQPGDLLWVREAWTPGYYHDADHEDGPKVSIIYSADGHEGVVAAPSYGFAEDWYCRFSEDGDTPPAKRPSIYLPRWASRITLEITDVRVERLQDISEEDARAEGIEHHAEGSAFWRDYQLKSLDGLHLPQHSFASLWDSIAASGVRWEDNPWVWVVSFRRVEK